MVIYATEYYTAMKMKLQLHKIKEYVFIFSVLKCSNWSKKISAWNDRHLLTHSSGARSLKSKCLQGHIPSDSTREESFYTFSASGMC